MVVIIVVIKNFLIILGFLGAPGSIPSIFSLNVSLFATDFIQGFPNYADEYCIRGSCETRFYGSISLNF